MSGGREAAHFCSMLLAALLLGVNTLCPCPGHISGASFFFLTHSLVSMFTWAPMCYCLELLVSCSLQAECLVIPGSATLKDKQQLLPLTDASQYAGPTGTTEEADCVTEDTVSKGSLEHLTALNKRQNDFYWELIIPDCRLLLPAPEP